MTRGGKRQLRLDATEQLVQLHENFDIERCIGDLSITGPPRAELRYVHGRRRGPAIGRLAVSYRPEVRGGVSAMR
jgi:hypothetical protein